MAELDSRYALETHNIAKNSVINLGYRHGPSDIIDAISRGEQVDPDNEIMRTHARLETGDPHFYWVNKTLFVGTEARNAGHVQIELYALR